jgi:hypothetical protein
MLGATLIPDMRWITGCRTNQDLERMIDGPRLKRTPGGAYKYTDRYSKYERGDDLPGYDSIERGKAATQCPELYRVIERMKLWWMLDPTRASYFMIWDAFKNLSQDVRQIVFTKRFHRDGEPKRRRRDDHSMYEELIRVNSVDALTVLAAFGLELYFSSSRISEFTRSDFKFLKKIAAGALGIFVRLMVFTPFFEAQKRILKYLDSWRRSFGDYPYVLLDLQNFDVAKFTADARALLNFAGKVGLIGSTFREQMDLVYWYHTSSRKEKILAEVNRIDYERRNGRTVRLRPSSSLYALLRRMGHRAVRSGKAIILPRRLKPGHKFELANALGPVNHLAIGLVEPDTPIEEKSDHDRCADIEVRFERSGNTTEVVN